jgi:hypothetical protein
VARQREAEAAAIAEARREQEAFEHELLHLRWLVKSMRLDLALQRLKEKQFNPNQPREPAGSSVGGRWTVAPGTGAGSLGNRDDTRVLSDVTPDNEWKPGAQYASMAWEERKKTLFNQRDLLQGMPYPQGGAGGGPPGGPWLPPFVARRPTSGILRIPGEDIQLVSGTGGPATRMPPQAAGYDAYTRLHVEGNAAALMRELKIDRATLYINNPKICPNCTRLLPSMLPPGASLDVVLPSGVIVPFKGIAP